MRCAFSLEQTDSGWLLTEVPVGRRLHFPDAVSLLDCLASRLGLPNENGGSRSAEEIRRVIRDVIARDEASADNSATIRFVKPGQAFEDAPDELDDDDEPMLTEDDIENLCGKIEDLDATVVVHNMRLDGQHERLAKIEERLQTMQGKESTLTALTMKDLNERIAKIERDSVRNFQRIAERLAMLEEGPATEQRVQIDGRFRKIEERLDGHDMINRAVVDDLADYSRQIEKIERFLVESFNAARSFIGHK